MSESPSDSQIKNLEKHTAPSSFGFLRWRLMWMVWVVTWIAIVFCTLRYPSSKFVWLLSFLQTLFIVCAFTLAYSKRNPLAIQAFTFGIACTLFSHYCPISSSVAIWVVDLTVTPEEAVFSRGLEWIVADTLAIHSAILFGLSCSFVAGVARLENNS